MHTALIPILLHAETPTQLDHSYFPVCAFYWGYSRKTVAFFTMAVCYLSAFISTQADKVKKLSFSESAFLCSDTDSGMLMKRQVFFVLARLPEQAFKSELSYLRGIQKGLRNYSATWSDLISREEAALHPLRYSTAAEQYIRQPICINSSKKAWQLQYVFPGRS